MGYTPPAVDLTATNAAIAAVQVTADAVEVDTGTTLPASLVALDAVVDTVKAETALILADTARMDTYIDRARPLVSMVGAMVGFSTASDSWVDVGLSLTTPNYAGETFTVVLGGFSWTTDAPDKYMTLQLHGASQGDQSDSNIVDGVVADSWVYASGFARTGFAANELVKLKMLTEGVTTGGVNGSIYLMCYQETQT
jgi:hypothetical protein|tara:strand:+ start:47 stop:637 length:591 start_codon:yes stop_codon:yes gene_type:complete